LSSIVKKKDAFIGFPGPGYGLLKNKLDSDADPFFVPMKKLFCGDQTPFFPEK